jgi:hypothetical protein
LRPGRFQRQAQLPLKRAKKARLVRLIEIYRIREGDEIIGGSGTAKTDLLNLKTFLAANYANYAN